MTAAAILCIDTENVDRDDSRLLSSVFEHADPAQNTVHHRDRLRGPICMLRLLHPRDRLS